MVSSEKFNAPKLVSGSENRCSFVFDKKYDELRWFSSYSRYGLRYERLQVIRKIPARDQAGEACLRELASQLPRREYRQPRRKAVQEQNSGSIPGTGFAIEDFQPLHVKRATENGRRNLFDI